MPLKNVTDRIDWDKDEAWLEFDLDARRIHWEVRLDGDWVDGGVFARLAKLLTSRRAGKRFTFYNLGGQHCLIGCATPDQVRRLRENTGVYFAWLGAGLI